jgi:hypothetical protein
VARGGHDPLSPKATTRTRKSRDVLSPVTNLEQGETEKHQDEPSPHETEDPD